MSQRMSFDEKTFKTRINTNNNNTTNIFTNSGKTPSTEALLSHFRSLVDSGFDQKLALHKIDSFLRKALKKH